MDFFSDALARLKHQLRVSKDQEVASLLGMGKTAFSERKKRGSFPEREVVALSASRPDLGIDVAYVLTGVPSSAHAAMGNLKSASDMAQRLGGTQHQQAQAAEVLFNQMQPQALAADEQMLVDAYRELDPAAKRQLMAFALGGAVQHPVGGQHSKGDNAIQIGHVAGKARIKNR